MKQLIILCLFAMPLVGFGQRYIINTVQDGAGKKRFEKFEVRQWETLSDTLLIDRYPQSWLDSAAFASYTVSLIDALMERQNEIRRLLKLNKDEADLYVSFYESTAGAGAYLALQKKRVLDGIAGTWTVIERGTANDTNHDVTIAGTELKKNNNRKGTISVTDDLTVLLTGFYNFDLTFRIAQNGTLRADRGAATYILKRK